MYFGLESANLSLACNAAVEITPSFPLLKVFCVHPSTEGGLGGGSKLANGTGFAENSYLKIIRMAVRLYFACLGKICFSSVHKNLKAPGQQQQQKKRKYHNLLLLILHTCVISLIKKAFTRVQLAFFQIASFFSAFSFSSFFFCCCPGICAYRSHYHMTGVRASHGPK